MRVQLCNFLSSFILDFGRSFLPFSGLFLYSPTPGGRLCSAQFTISQVDWWSYPKEADEVELCLWSFTHPTHEHPAIFPPSKIEGAERGVKVVATSGSWPPKLCFCSCYLPIVISPTTFVPETMMLYSQP